jgi:phenylacetate-CoA ligase
MNMSKIHAAYFRQYDERIAAVVHSAAASVPAFIERLQTAGVAVASLTGVDDLSALPILSKDEILLQQRASPPFGGWLGDSARVRRIYQSPGPIYEPQLAGSDPWRSRWALEAAGFTERDLVLNCFGYHLTPAGAMFEEGSFAVGAAVVPAGTGSKDLQAALIADMGVTAFTGLPSYLKALIERYEELGLPAERWRLARAAVSAEPLSDELRAVLNRRVPLVLMSYGTAETGLLGFEDRPGDGMVVPDDVLVQICDLDTGQPIASGEGQVVVSVLRPEYPLIRFGTGDISAWREGPDGRPRLVGILGRVGQAVKIRGMFLHPSQATAALKEVPGIVQFRFVVSSVDHTDQLRCEIVPAVGLAPEAVSDVVRNASAQISAALRFRCVVDAVDSLPLGAKVIDDRRS